MTRLRSETSRPPGTEPAVNGDPAAVIRAYYRALNDGDLAGANGRIHSEAPNIEVTDQMIRGLADLTLTIERPTVVEEGRILRRSRPRDHRRA